MFHTILKLAIGLGLAAAGLAATAHGDAPPGKARDDTVRKEQKPWGIAGDRKAVTRTIEIA